MGLENIENSETTIDDTQKHPLEEVPAFDPEAAIKRVEKEKAELLERDNNTGEQNVERYASPLDYIDKNGLNDPDTVEEIIQSSDYASFKKHLINLNGLMRNLDITNHGIDGERVIIPQGLTPISPELKDDVLEEMFDAMKDIDSPKDRGALAYHTLGLLHLFSDGNGRSQRVWQQLFSGQQLSDEKMRILTEHGIGDVGDKGRMQMGKLLNTQYGQVSTTINDFAFEYDFDGYTGVVVDAFCGEPIFSDEAIAGCLTSDMDRVKNIFSNDRDSIRFSFPEMAATILKGEDDSFDVPETFIDDTNKLRYKASDKDGFAANFGFKSPSQVKRFIEIHDQLKLKQFHVMIDAFKNPQSYKYDNVDVTLVDVLEKPFIQDS